LKNQYLALPGPTAVCPEALQAMSEPMFNHRGPKFQELYHRVINNCRELFQTKNDLFVLTGSGTGAMESAIVNTISPGTEVLAIINGAFGQRFADIARVFGANVHEFHGEWGHGLDLEQLELVLKQETFKAILLVHCETSTGVLNQLEEIAVLARRYQPEVLFLVDAISSLGAAPLKSDDWDLDVVVTGSQKALAAPPGVAMLSFSPRAWRAYEKSTSPKYYWDMKKNKDFMDKGQTPWTPAISQFFALEKASKRFVDEGIENSVKRHQRMARMTRAGVKALGLELLCPDNVAATTVTAIHCPVGFNVGQIRTILLEKYGLDVAAGQGKLVNSIFRIGHLGIADEQTVVAYLYGLEQGLKDLGMSFSLGTAISAALGVLESKK